MAQGEGQGREGGGVKRLLAAALIALAAPVSAQAPAPSAAATAKARELITVMRADELTRKTLDAQMNGLTAGLADQIFKSGSFPPAMADDPEFRSIMQRHMDRTFAIIGDQMRQAMPQLVDAMVDAYARQFTPAQIDDMIAFYRTPTGQVVLQKTPDITTQIGLKSRDLTLGPIMQTIKATTPQLMSELKAWSDKHPQAKTEQP
jgi:uncharacterized protein